MTGPIAFARTLRALDADSFRISNLVLLLAIALLAGWIWWLFEAGVPQYEDAIDVRVETNRFVATFPARVLEHVRPGQSATLKLDGAVVPAKLSALAIDAASGQVQAILLPATEQPPPGAANAAASVEVERVSPVTLLRRAIGGANR